MSGKHCRRLQSRESSVVSIREERPFCSDFFLIVLWNCVFTKIAHFEKGELPLCFLLESLMSVELSGRRSGLGKQLISRK